MAKKAKKRKSSFAGKVNASARKKAAADSGFSHFKLPENVKSYKPTPGARESFDIIPYIVTDENHMDRDDECGVAIVGDPWYKKTYKVHKQVGAENKTVVCLQTFGKKCPICEYRKQQQKEGADKDTLKEMNTKERALYLVIPKGHKKLEEELHILDFSTWLFEKQLNEETNETEEYESFPDLEEGYTLKVRWTKESHENNPYAKAGRIDFNERDEQYGDDYIDDVPDLDELLIELPYKVIESMFFELDDEDVDTNAAEEEEEETPKAKAKKGKAKKAKKEEPEPEEEDEEEDGVVYRDEYTFADLLDMNEEVLIELIEEEGLDIDSEDYEDDENGLREAIAEELDIEIEPPKKKEKKEKGKPSKKEEKAAKKPAKTAKKDVCPVDDDGFGIDVDDHDECDTCKLYDKCLAKFEND